MPHIIFEEKKIFYRLSGTGKTVVLLHGFAEDGTVWNKQIPELSENCFLIIPDLPGSGQSEMLDGNRTMKDYAEVVHAIIQKEVFENDQQTDKKVCVIGHSMGGYITLAFVEKYSSLVSAFGLFHSSAFADSEEKKQKRRKGIEFIRKNDTDAFLRTSVSDLFSEKSKKEHPDWIGQLVEIGRTISPEALIQYYDAMIQRPDRTEVLRQSQHPVLFIMGEEDKAVPIDISLKQCHIPAISSIHILKNSAHMGMWEEQESATSFLINFVRNIAFE